MKIQQVKELDDGVSGITIEGKIIKTPKPPNNGEYGWSQMIILKDDTGEIGSWIKIASAEDAYKVGQYIKVQGKVSKYMKGDKPGISLNNGQVIEEIIKEEKMQEPAQSSESSTQSSNGTKDNYWGKKFDWEVKKDKRVQYLIVRQCAIKCATELAVAKIAKGNKGDNLKDKTYFECADRIVDWVYKKELTSEDITEEFGGTAKVETKEERTKKAEEVVGKTRFKPASTDQKKIIFGYTDKEGYHKGMIDSRYIETHEIKEIGDPKKLSVVEAFKWIEFWWGEQGNPDDVGARKQREIDNPRNENGKLVNALVKGDKTSVTKDMLVDEIYALRRENRLNDDEKFKEVMGYNPKIEELTEAECLKLKDLLIKYVPF